MVVIADHPSPDTGGAPHHRQPRQQHQPIHLRIILTTEEKTMIHKTTKTKRLLEMDDDKCPKCYSTNVVYGFSVGEPEGECLNCGHLWSDAE